MTILIAVLVACCAAVLAQGHFVYLNRTSSPVVDIVRDGNILYVLLQNGGVSIYSLSTIDEPTPLASLTLNHPVSAAVINGSFLYAAHPDGYLSSINVGDPQNPRLMNEAILPFTIQDMAVSGYYLLCAASYDGLVIINMENSFIPVVRAILDTGGFARNLYIHYDTAYVAMGADGVAVVDISNILNPGIRSAYQSGRFAHSINGKGDLLYIANATQGFEIVDFENTPEIVRSIIDSSPAFAITFQSSCAMIFGTSLHIYSALNPDNPFQQGEYGLLSIIYSAEPVGNRFIVSMKNNGWGILIIEQFETPLPLGSINLGEYVYSIDVHENVVYAGVGRNGFRVIDIQSPENPQIFYSYRDYGAWHVRMFDDMLYLSDRNGGMIRMNTTNPYLPVFNDRFWGYSGNSIRFTVSSDKIYLASLYYGIRILDKNSLVSLNLPDPLLFDFSAHDVVVSGSVAYLIDEFQGILLFDITDTAAPLFLNQIQIRRPRSTALRDSYLYLAANEYGIDIFDVSNPYFPTQIGHCDTFFAREIKILRDDTAFVADGNGGLVILDIADKTKPFIRARHRYAPFDTLESLAVTDNEVVLGYGSAGIIVIPLTGLLPKTSAPSPHWTNYY